MSDEMVKALEQERKARKLESIPEAVRAVLGEYFKTKEGKKLAVLEKVCLSG